MCTRWYSDIRRLRTAVLVDLVSSSGVRTLLATSHYSKEIGFPPDEFSFARTNLHTSIGLFNFVDEIPFEVKAPGTQPIFCLQTSLYGWSVLRSTRGKTNTSTDEIHWFQTTTTFAVVVYDPVVNFQANRGNHVRDVLSTEIQSAYRLQQTFLWRSACRLRIWTRWPSRTVDVTAVGLLSR